MSWSSFVRSILSTAAGTAAGAATLPAGGPIAAAVANKAATNAAEAIMDQFMEAENSILSRIDEINREMKGRLVDLQAGVDALLDKDYRAALLHLEEAARVPERAPGELQAARSKLFDAWGAANTPIRKYLVAQHLAVVYALLNDSDMVKRWLMSSLEGVQAEVSGQVSRLHPVVVGHLANPRRSSGNAGKDALHFRVQVNAPRRDISMDQARNAVRHPFVVPKRDSEFVYPRQNWEGFIPRNADLEGWLSGLAELDAESAGACRLCEGVVRYIDMPPWGWRDGVVRVYKGKTERSGQRGVLVRFSQFVAVEFTISGSQDSPICRPLPAELRQARNWQPTYQPVFEETYDYDAEGFPTLWQMGSGLDRFVTEPGHKRGAYQMMYFG
jgi:hypothetical protein